MAVLSEQSDDFLAFGEIAWDLVALFLRVHVGALFYEKRHDPTAMQVFWLLAQICLTVFYAFFRRNLKPAARATVSMLHVARLVQAELYLPQTRSRP